MSEPLLPALTSDPYDALLNDLTYSVHARADDTPDFFVLSFQREHPSGASDYRPVRCIKSAQEPFDNRHRHKPCAFMSTRQQSARPPLRLTASPAAVPSRCPTLR